MKTTLEMPDQLYREVKATAALKNKSMKELVARGLELVLEEESQTKDPHPLEIMREIRKNPPYSSARVMEMQEEAYRLRKEGWEE